MTNTSAAPFKCFVVEYATALVFRAGKLSPSNFLGRNEEDEERKKRSLSRKWWLARSFKFKSRDEAKRMKKGLDIAHTQTLWRSFMHYSWRKLNNTYTTKFKPFFLVFWRQEIVKNLFIFFNLLSNLLIFAQHFFFRYINVDWFGRRAIVLLLSAEWGWLGEQKILKRGLSESLLRQRDGN